MPECVREFAQALCAFLLFAVALAVILCCFKNIDSIRVSATQAEQGAL